MKDNFMLKIETWHKPDKGEIPNVRIEIYLFMYKLEMRVKGIFKHVVCRFS